MKTTMLLSALLVCAPVLADDGGRDMTGKKELQMEHCPSAVMGSSTRVHDISDGVEVVVTAPQDLIAQQEIRRRVEFQLQIVDQPERGAIEHTGFGTGSGQYGFCPGMMSNTSFNVKWIPDGAIMIIRADKPEDVKALQRSTHKRARALYSRMHRVAWR